MEEKIKDTEDIKRFNHMNLNNFVDKSQNNGKCRS